MISSELVQAGHFHFDPDDPIYVDHFPENPVVPGSLIVDAFMTAAGPAMQGQGGACCIEDFRFKRFISPGCYAFHMERKAEGLIRCTLYDNGRPVVTGTLGKRVSGSKFRVQGSGGFHAEG